MPWHIWAYIIHTQVHIDGTNYFTAYCAGNVLPGFSLLRKKSLSFVSTLLKRTEYWSPVHGKMQCHN